MTLREKLEQLKASEDKNEAIMEAFSEGCRAGIACAITAAEIDSGCVLDEGANMRIAGRAAIAIFCDDDALDVLELPNE